MLGRRALGPAGFSTNAHRITKRFAEDAPRQPPGGEYGEVRTRLSIVIAIGLLAAAVGGLAAPAQSATVYNVKTYGAKANGTTNDAAAACCV